MKLRACFVSGLILVLAFIGCARVGATPSDSNAGGMGGEGGAEASGGHSAHAGDSPGGLGGNNGSIDQCCILGALCHVAGGDVDPEVEECHQIGHKNDAAECAAEFDRCHELCEGTNDEPEPHACTR
jgi:hypothetical protein